MLKMIISILTQRSRSLILLYVTLFPSYAKGEIFDVKIGQDQVEVVSSQYEKKSSSSAAIAVAYSRQLTGRWSGFAEYRNTIDNSLSAGVLGVAFDTEDLMTKGGFISGDGSPEIARIPIWMTRISIGLGIFRLVDVLKSNDASLGNRNLVPVKASPFGIKLGVSLHKFFNEFWAGSAGVSYISATAGDFGVSATGIQLGVFFNLN